jgi:F-type H+-transporting ATPase subunit b
MPQFDSSTFSSQIFWLFVTGFALICFVKFVLLPRIEIIFKNRRNFLHEEQESINALENQIENLKVERQREIHLAEQKAHDFLLLIKKDLDVKKKQHIDLLTKEMQEKVASFEESLSKKALAVKEDYKKNVEQYIETIKEKVTYSDGNHVK